MTTKIPEIKEGQVWRTRDGGEATIETILEDSVFPVRGSVTSGDGYHMTETWLRDGHSRIGMNCENDLVELLTGEQEKRMSSLEYFREKFFGTNW